MWRVWRPKFKWENLCPIIFADPLGLVVVIARARESVSLEDMIAADTDEHPDINVEYDKLESWGWLTDRVVAVDYGLWDALKIR